MLKPFRDVAPIVADGSGPLPYPALNGAFDVLYPKGLRAYWKGAFVKDLSDAAIAAHVEHGSNVPEVTCTMHLYPINGACHRVGSERHRLRLPRRHLRDGVPRGMDRPGERRRADQVAPRLLRGPGAALGAWLHLEFQCSGDQATANEYRQFIDFSRDACGPWTSI